MKSWVRPNRWLWLLATAGALILLAGVGAGLLRRAEARERAVWRARLEGMVLDRKAALERWAQDLASDAATVAAYPTAVWLLDGRPAGPLPFPAEEGAERHLRDLLAAAAAAHRYRAAWLLDASDSLVAASTDEGVPPAAGLLADSALRTGGSTLQLRLVAGRPAVLVATPVLRPGTEVRLGAVVLEEDPQTFLYPLLTYEPVPTRSGEVLLSEAYGERVLLLSPARKDPALLLRPLEHAPAARGALAGRAAFLAPVADYAGEAVWAATETVVGTGWGLHAKIDEAEALAPGRRGAWLEILALAGLLAAGFGVAFGIYRQQRATRVAAVARERARYEALLMHANDAILIADPDGTIRRVNERAVELYGRPAEWFEGRSARELRPAPLRRSFPEQVAAVAERGQILFETDHLDAAGRPFPVEISARLVHLNDTRILLSIVRDLRERHAAERALRESEEKYRAIVENTPDVVARIGRDFRLLYISPSITRQLAGRPGDFLGRRVDELGFPGEISTLWLAAIDSVFADGRPRELEFPLSVRDGLRHWAWRAFPEYDANGNICAVVNVTQDVTERRRLEEQFQQAQKMEAIGRLAGGVAHDFNNILTAIHGHATLAREGVAEENTLATSLDEIVAASERAASLTRQLLAFSRRQLLQPRRVDLAASIRSMAPMLQRLIGEDVEIVYEFPAEPLPVLADPAQIEQVLLNLSVNARDAMEAGGRLTIGLREAGIAGDPLPGGRYVVLTVADTGTGIPPEVMHRIFEPFFTTKDAGRGTGLGLSTVYGIVQQCHGHVEVASEPGRGTTFTIFLPYLAGAPEASAESEAPLPAPQEGRTVLLAEDDVMVRELTERVLRKVGYRVLSAANGVEALLLAAGEPTIDLLLTDVVMPELGGIELATRLRAERPRMAVVFMTGYTEDFSSQASPIDPRLHIVQKPFRGGELLRQLEDALQPV